MSALGGLGQRVERSMDSVTALAAGTGEDTGSALTPLVRLGALCSASDYLGFHAVAQGSFDGPSGLRQALDLHDRLEQLSTLAPAITSVRRYLGEMTFGRDDQDLAMKRDSIKGRVGLDSLAANPSLWNSVEESFRQLSLEYASAYLAHHARHHEQAAELVSRLETWRPQIEALARFNDVPELGGPLGADLPERFWELLASVRTCGTSEDQVSLEDAPFCRECLLPLDENVPLREATLLLSETKGAMRVYNRRLSSEAVRRILDHPTTEQLDKFVGIVQVSDLSFLGNVLDEQVIGFLRRFVRPG